RLRDVPDGGRVRGVRHGHDHGPLLALLDLRDGRVVGHRLAHLAAHLVHHRPVDHGVGPGEVDVLEDALAHAVAARHADAVELAAALGPRDPRPVDHQDLARLDVADVGGADEVEGARLARHAVGRAPVLALDAA